MTLKYSDTCDCTILHEETVEEVRRVMPAEELIYEVSELFRVFGDSTRARILCALTAAEMCVCDLAALLGMTQSAISHQLRVLKQTRLVKNRRQGKVVYYSLADQHIKELFDTAFIHVTEE